MDRSVDARVDLVPLAQVSNAVTIGLAVVASAALVAVAYAEVAAPLPSLRVQPRNVLRPALPLPSTRAGNPLRMTTLVTPNEALDDRTQSHSGVCVVDGRVTIASYDNWIAFSSRAIAEALVDGARGADGVLIHVMRRALPRHQWPPDPTSAMATQWPQMVQVVAERLHLEPEPQPQRTTQRLRLM